MVASDGDIESLGIERTARGLDRDGQGRNAIQNGKSEISATSSEGSRRKCPVAVGCWITSFGQFLQRGIYREELVVTTVIIGRGSNSRRIPRTRTEAIRTPGVNHVDVSCTPVAGACLTSRTEWRRRSVRQDNHAPNNRIWYIRYFVNMRIDSSTCTSGVLWRISGGCRRWWRDRFFSLSYTVVLRRDRHIDMVILD